MALLAGKAAKKHASPPEIDDKVDYIEEVDDTVDTYGQFLTKVLSNIMSPENLRVKILEKSTENECRIQLKILDLVENLNTYLMDKKPVVLFQDQTCLLLYNEILDIQASQHFTASGWKCVAFAVLVPMINRIHIFVAGVFHTRKVPLFFSWKRNSKSVHPDMNLASNVMSDIVEQHIESPLVEKPTPTAEKFIDWFNQSSLESFDRSDREDRNEPEKVEPGNNGKVQKEEIPVMKAQDISLFSRIDDVTTTDSYLDISFVNPKRRLNLTKQDKIDILNAPGPSSEGPSSSHSTPIRPINPLRPKLGSMMKKTNFMSRTGTSANNYITRFLNKWFSAQITDISAQLKQELEKSME